MSDKHEEHLAQVARTPGKGIEHLDFNAGLTCQSQCCETDATAAFALVKPTAVGLRMIREAFHGDEGPTSWLSCERSTLMNADAGYVTIVQVLN